MTSDNANVSGDIRDVDGNNCNVSRNKVNVVGDIRYAGCCIAEVGDRIANAGNCINSVPAQPTDLSYTLETQLSVRHATLPCRFICQGLTQLAA